MPVDVTASPEAYSGLDFEVQVGDVVRVCKSGSKKNSLCGVVKSVKSRKGRWMGRKGIVTQYYVALDDGDEQWFPQHNVYYYPSMQDIAERAAVVRRHRDTLEGRLGAAIQEGEHGLFDLAG